MSVLLLVDDEPRLAKLVEMTLDGSVRVVTAYSIEEAVAAAKKSPPDIVLLDLSLGDEDGLQMLPLFRNDPVLAKIPIIVFTVHDSKREDALALGADGFVAKPFKAADLQNAVGPYLSGDVA